jgi:hypothetical protein
MKDIDKGCQILSDTITLKKQPTAKIEDGLLVRFDSETDTETEWSITDINERQTDYSIPNEKRRIRGIYQRIY